MPLKSWRTRSISSVTRGKPGTRKSRVIQEACLDSGLDAEEVLGGGDEEDVDEDVRALHAIHTPAELVAVQHLAPQRLAGRTKDLRPRSTPPIPAVEESEGRAARPGGERVTEPVVQRRIRRDSVEPVGDVLNAHESPARTPRCSAG